MRSVTLRYSNHRRELVGEHAAGLALGPARGRARPQRQPRQRRRAAWQLRSTGVTFRSTSDSEIIAALLSTIPPSAIEDAVAT
jgi:hypothetical protein